MNCYDCLSRDRTTPAVAVCSHCHAGLCADHVTMTSHTVREQRGTGQVTQDLQARRALCGVCERVES